MTSRPHTKRSVARILLAILIGTASVAVAQRSELPTAAPATVGFSVERLAALDVAMRKVVDEGRCRAS